MRQEMKANHILPWSQQSGLYEAEEMGLWGKLY
jgi:hypothetical protein